jgi:transposase
VREGHRPAPFRGQPLSPEDPIGNTSIDPEVGIKKERRQYSAEYRRKVLTEADQCKSGELGALLRREGLYNSHLSKWRHQRAAGEFAGLSPQKRGKKADPHAHELNRLRQQVTQLNQKLARAELIMAAQKKLADLLGLPICPSIEPNE